jgi:predicted DNA-binding protein with PD1-like motif
MQSKQIAQSETGSRTFALVFQAGDEPISLLQQFAAAHNLSASQFTAIGAFRDVTVAYFNWETKQYQHIPVHEQVEVLTLIGDVSVDESGQPKVHAHVVLGRSDGSTRGGHLLEAHVRPTLEVILTESPSHLRRHFDPDSGLALIRL